MQFFFATDLTVLPCVRQGNWHLVPFADGMMGFAVLYPVGAYLGRYAALRPGDMIVTRTSFFVTWGRAPTSASISRRLLCDQ